MAFTRLARTVLVASLALTGLTVSATASHAEPSEPTWHSSNVSPAYASGYGGTSMDTASDGKVAVTNYLAGSVTVFQGQDVVLNVTGFLRPHDVAFDGKGSLYVAQFGRDLGPSRIGLIDLQTGTTDYSWLGGFGGLASLDIAPDGALWVADADGNALYRVDVATKQKTQITGSWPAIHGLRFDSKGNLFSELIGLGTILKLDPRGNLSTFAAGLDRPVGLTVDSNGGVYVAEPWGNDVVYIDKSGTKHVVATGVNQADGVTLVQGGLLIGSFFQQRVYRVDLLAAPLSVSLTSASTSLGVQWSAVTSPVSGATVSYMVTTDSGESCTTTGTSCDITNLIDRRNYRVTVTASDGTYTSLPSSVISSVPTASLANGDYFDFTESETFSAPVPGLYRVQLIGAGGQGGSQCWGWVAGGGGGGGGYVDGSVWLSNQRDIRLEIGKSTVEQTEACVSRYANLDGVSGTDTAAELTSGAVIIAEGGDGGHGVSDNQGGAGGSYASYGGQYLDVTGFQGGHGGPAIIRASFSYGWHEGGEGGSAANSDGNGFDGTTVVCSWTARAQTGDLPAGAGGHGPSGGYGAYVNECSLDGSLISGQKFGAGGMGCHCFGKVGASGYARVTLVRVATPPSAPAISSVVAFSAQATLGITAPSDLGDASLSGYDYSINNGTTWSHFASVTGPFVIGGLTNGTTYQVKVRGVNSMGAGEASVALAVSPTKLIPAKPVIASVAAGNALATVTITKPTDPTSQSITGYQYSINKGASYQPVSVANGKFTITGLANGVATSVQIRATNFNGNSLASVAKTVTPATTPSAPTIGSITPSAGALSIAFTAASTGGSAITGYQYSLDGGSNWITPKTVVKTSPLKLTGLANATTYHVQLRSVNARGTGSASATVDATTPALIPGAPVIASITKTRTSLTVDVTAPLNTGGGAILNYAYSTDGKTWVPVSPASSSTHIVINDLKTNTLYAIRIAAINSAGQGAFASSAARTLQ